MNPDHARFAEWDSAYVLGALSPAERREYEEHLESCELCRRCVAELTPIPGAVRYWGGDVLVPLGHRPEPDLAPETLRAAAGASAEELLVLDGGGAEVVPRAAFAPLTRAGVRLCSGAKRSSHS